MHFTSQCPLTLHILPPCVTLVSLERYLAICYPLKHRIMNSKSRTITLVVTTWSIAAVLAAIVSLGQSELVVICIIWPEKYQQILPSIVPACSPLSPAFLNIGSIFDFGTFIVGLISNTVFYTMIVRRLGHREVTQEVHQEGQSQMQNIRNSVARMLILNGTCFFICLSVLQFYNLFAFIRHNSDGRILLIAADKVSTVHWAGIVLSVLNSSINPVIYSVSNGRYRRAFVKAFVCHCKRNQPQDTPVVSNKMRETKM